jgi:hypothetical protein
MMSVDVGALLDQESCNLEVFFHHGIVQRGLAEVIEGIDVAPLRKESAHFIQVAVLSGEVKQHLLEGVLLVVVSVHPPAPAAGDAADRRRACHHPAR